MSNYFKLYQTMSENGSNYFYLCLKANFLPIYPLYFMHFRFTVNEKSNFRDNCLVSYLFVSYFPFYFFASFFYSNFYGVENSVLPFMFHTEFLLYIISNRQVLRILCHILFLIYSLFYSSKIYI